MVEAHLELAREMLARRRSPGTATARPSPIAGDELADELGLAPGLSEAGSG